MFLRMFTYTLYDDNHLFYLFQKNIINLSTIPHQHPNFTLLQKDKAYNTC